MDEGNKTKLIYSREYLVKYDTYTLDQGISNLVNQLNNNWARHTPKKVSVSPRSMEGTPTSTDPKSPNRSAKTLPKKSIKNNSPFDPQKAKFEKNGKVPLIKSSRVAPPPGFSKSDFLDSNDTVYKANSFPSVFNYHQHVAPLGDETPRKMASSPLISYVDHIFPSNLPMPFDPSLQGYGESKFVSLFSQQPVTSDICGEINLKVPYLSLDFIEDLPQPQSQPQLQTQQLQASPPLQLSPRTPTAKPLLSPKSHEAEKSPFKNSKTPQKSPRNRPVSPLDDQRLIQRQKQIDYGYRTVGYLRYRLLVSKESRKPEHPRTPKKAQGCSKRSWDGQLKKWRRDLHLWDPDNLEGFRALLNSEVVESLVSANPELEDVVRAVRDKLDNPNKMNEDDFEDEEEVNLSASISKSMKKNGVKAAEENQVISEPNKSRVARTLFT